MGGLLRCETWLPVKLSRRLARFNRAITNPIQGSYAWLLAPWVVVCHRGRRTGRTYRTPVNAYRRGRVLAIVVLYGEESDWVRNVLAGEAQVVRAGRTYDLLRPHLLATDAADTSVPVMARMIGRLSGKLLVGELGEQHGGFGRGPGVRRS
jgi:deazaflavin-dependent oxidoreductase (nitroreductase family)